MAAMKEKSNAAQLPSKDEIRRMAEAGVFDRNPLLAVPHEVRCKDCGYGNRAIFLEFLRSGKFEVGETKIVEVTYAAPTFTGLGRTLERSTPLMFRIECKRCGTVTTHTPMSLEYLLFTSRKRETPGIYI